MIFANGKSDRGPDRNAAQPLPKRKSGFRIPDLRFLIGVLLIGASIAGVLTVLNLANKGIQILTAARTLLPGELVVEADLEPVTISADRLSADYLLAGSIPESGLIATRVIMAGEFVPKSALGLAASESYTSIVIELANKIPGSIGPGSVVDLWSTAKSDSEFEPP
ncbi:MAG: SAF domain-containing protein, partial [Cryobacterium sp.]|nr:SAF domain-containing protein [Cryobacterium sp.]